MPLALFMLLAALPSLAEGDHLAPYRGQPIVAVNMHVPDDEDVSALRHLINIQPGYLLSTEELQASIKRLYALGRFAAVDVYAERLSGSVILTFHLTYAKRMRSLRIIGTNKANSDELRAALDIKSGDELDRRTPQRIKQRALYHLHRVGFPNAEVSVETEMDDSQGLGTVLLFVEEGSPLIVGSIEFLGQRRVHPKLLQVEVKSRPNEILDHRKLEADRNALQAAYLQRGFLSAMVRRPRIESVGNTARIVFEIDAGNRFVLRFRGNQSISGKHLRRLWPAPDSPMESDTLDTFANRIERFYAEQSRRGTTVEIRSVTRPDEPGTTYCLVLIKEGERLRVRSLAFENVSVFDASVLRRQVEATLEEALGHNDVFEPIFRGDLRAAWSEHSHEDPNIPPRHRWVAHLYDKSLRDIAAAYRDRGYLSAEVGPPELKYDGQFVDVRVPVNEGLQSFIASISFKGNEGIDASGLFNALAIGASSARVLPGTAYSPTAVEDSRIELVRVYRDHGYLYARVFTEAVFSKDQSSVDLAYRFEEGPKVHLQSVLIRGHRYTLQSLIQGRMSLKAGDLYRLEQALNDQRNIAGLGVFSSVRVKLIDEESPSELKDLVAEVVERDRQPVDLAVGLSTADGPRLRASYAHINVFGTASTFTASLKINRKLFFPLYGELGDTLQKRYDEFGVLEEIERQVRAGIRSPRILSLPFAPSFRMDLVQERENAVPYSLESLTGILGADLQLTNRLTMAIEPQVSLTGLRCESTTIDAQTDDCLGAFASLRPDQRQIDTGLKRTFKIGPRIIWDRRDNPFNPTSGFFLNTEAVYAMGSTQDADRHSGLDLLGVGGGWQPFSFVRMQATLTGYITVRRATLALSARAGGIRVFPQGGSVDFPAAPIDERFFLGGRDSIRGFVEGALVAEDVCVVPRLDSSLPSGCNDALVPAEDPRTGRLGAAVSRGGHSFMLLKSELRVPVGDQLSVGLFVDAGNLWFRYPELNNLAVRFGVGAGLRYGTPVGPIAIDIGVNPAPRAVNSEPRWQPHFSIGVF